MIFSEGETDTPSTFLAHSPEKISGGTFPFWNRLSLLSGNVLERCGTLPILIRRNRAEISLKLRGKWKLFACAFNGKRKFEVSHPFREGKTVFTAENLSAHGAPSTNFRKSNPKACSPNGPPYSPRKKIRFSTRRFEHSSPRIFFSRRRTAHRICSSNC